MMYASHWMMRRSSVHCQMVCHRQVTVPLVLSIHREMSSHFRLKYPNLVSTVKITLKKYSVGIMPCILSIIPCLCKSSYRRPVFFLWCCGVMIMSWTRN